MHQILLVGPSWVGDMVMAHSLIRFLAQDTEVAIDVLAPGWTAALLNRMPEVREVIVSPFEHGRFDAKKRYQLGRSLRKTGYEQAYVLPNAWKAALVPFFAKIPERIGWLGEQRWGLLNKIHRLDTARYPYMVERFVALALAQGEKKSLKECPKPQLVIQEDNLKQVLQAQGLVLDRPVLALCPGAAYGPAKRWPAQYFGEVAREKLAQGWQVWLFGSAGDQALTAVIQKETSNQCVDLAGQTSLADAVDLLSSVDAVVCNDSGLMHIAASLERPLVAVFGSTSTQFTPPLSEKVALLMKDLPCRPCFERTCPLQHMNCLNEIQPKQVLLALEKLKEESVA